MGSLVGGVDEVEEGGEWVRDEREGTVGRQVV